MDSKRAEEILLAQGTINVYYKGAPIWIEGVSGDIANVSVIGENRRMDVPLKALSESNSR